MEDSHGQRGPCDYDRNFLLSPAKRNHIVELWEVEKFGRDSFGDSDAVALYGVRPAEWYAKGSASLHAQRLKPCEIL